MVAIGVVVIAVVPPANIGAGNVERSLFITRLPHRLDGIPRRRSSFNRRR